MKKLRKTKRSTLSKKLSRSREISLILTLESQPVSLRKNIIISTVRENLMKPRRKLGKNLENMAIKPTNRTVGTISRREASLTQTTGVK